MMTNKKFCLFLPVFAGMTLVLMGCQRGAPLMKQADSMKATQVKTVVVTPTDVRRTTLQPASVHAYFRAEIRSKSGGYISEVVADIGDYVEAGAPLALIDIPEITKQRQVIEARIKRFVAEEARAQAGIDLAAAQVLASEALLAQSKSSLGKADALLAAADAELSRTKDMVDRGSLQQRMLDESKMKRDSEAAGKEAMNASIRSAEAEVSVARAKQESANADLEAARAETEIATRQLEEVDVLIAYATLKAPFAGVVTQRNVEPGDLVRQESEVGSGKPLFVISQSDRVRVRVPVPETDAPLVNVDDKITLTFPSFADEEPIVASVTRRSGSLDASTRTMMIEADLDNSEGKLIPGMFGQASIELATNVAANMLPSRAIRFNESGEAYVYALSDDDKVTVFNIETGIDDGNRIEVRSGLEPGQKVIDAHLKRFTDGQQVAVLK